MDEGTFYEYVVPLGGAAVTLGVGWFLWWFFDVQGKCEAFDAWLNRIEQLKAAARLGDIRPSALLEKDDAPKP